VTLGSGFNVGALREMSELIRHCRNDEAGAMSSFSLASKLPISGHQGTAPSYHIYPRGIYHNIPSIQALHLIPLHNTFLFLPMRMP
jgi:hypothetical protein